MWPSGGAEGCFQGRLTAHSAAIMFAFVMLIGGSLSVRAEETYTSPDGKLTFSLARRWQAENAGDRVRLTAPDGTTYYVLRDTVSVLPGDSPAANPELKARAI